MMHPDTKRIGEELTVSVDEAGYPYWTRITGRSGYMATLNAEQARDLHYALSRAIAWLDFVERRDAARGIL